VLYVDHTYSSFSKVISGVPQGSALDPTLFLLYINEIDLDSCGHTDLQLLTDDAKLYSSINKMQCLSRSSNLSMM
jgi:hypothetical protein